ncbi:MAG: 4Fe-4S dicluster domain-containing protein [Chloroflexi bacterium]|nr:4Fe-4S dicluster domain-containing protein [Chloroflexota bacterium]
MDPYRALAERLDALPNGFPATESGVELRLLAKLFAAQEAALAAAMSDVFEHVTEIAGRAGVSAETAAEILESMVHKGLIMARRARGESLYALMPFVVGFYEMQLPRMDAELAALVEQYFQESGGRFVAAGPAVHRVIPVGEAIPAEVEVLPYERATALIEGARSWAVRDCICRLQQRLVGKGCDRPLESCLVFAPLSGAFDGSEVDRVLTKEEALQILFEAEAAGLVHTVGNYRRGTFYICNCCTCCCGVLRRVAEFDEPAAIARAAFHAVVDVERCLGCGECLARCPFGALSLAEDVVAVDRRRCVGCGQCTLACTAKALRLERRPASEVEAPPADPRAWSQERAARRRLLGTEG